MESQTKKLVVVITKGLDDERSSVAWSIANGGIKSGLEVAVFLASSGIDWVRKGAADRVHLNPEDPPMIDMIRNVLDSGCKVGACPPCAKVRGYNAEDIMEGVEIVGSVFIHDRVKQGAAILTL